MLGTELAYGGTRVGANGHADGYNGDFRSHVLSAYARPTTGGTEVAYATRLRGVTYCGTVVAYAIMLRGVRY
eukprot:2437654-Rhodomonas_salina.2